MGETELCALVRDEVRRVIREQLASNTSEFFSVADAAQVASISPQTIALVRTLKAVEEKGARA